MFRVGRSGGCTVAKAIRRSDNPSASSDPEKYIIAQEHEELDSYIVFWMIRAALLFFRVIPRSAGRHLLNMMADAVFFLDRRHRNIASINMRIAFPDLSSREHSRIIRMSFRGTAQNLLEISRLASLQSDSISRLVEYDPACGLNNYEAARARGKPILYLTGHFGAWELLPAAHALHGHPLAFVTRPLDNRPLEEFLRRAREHCGNRVISRKNATRRILETLKNGGAVGILLDHNTSLGEGIFSEFFGIDAATSTGLALMALRTDATVLTGYLTPLRPDGRYRIKFLPPLDLIRTGDTNQDVILNTRLFNKVLEGIVREQPESWLWGHKRWKNQPPGAPADLYSLSDEELERFLQNRRSLPAQN